MKVPNKFWFYHCSDEDIVYFAEGDEHKYTISGGNLLINKNYTTDLVEVFLQEGLWVMVETDIPKDEPLEEAFVEKTISINVNSVRAAAEFDVANNKHTIKKGLSVEEIEQEILKYVREMYSGLMSGEFEWKSRGIGTRSYIVRFRVEDENYGVISVEVDPSIGKPIFYAPVEDFLNQN